MRPLNRAALALALFLSVFGVWSAQGRFATTLHMPGSIGSTAPSYPVQHQWGGKLTEIHVAMHQPVQAGDVLFRMDSTDLDLRLADLDLRRTEVKTELAEIGQRLASVPLTAAPAQQPAQVLLAYAVQDQTLQAEIANLDAQSAAARAQDGKLAREIDHLQDLSRILGAQRDRIAVLTRKGLATDQALETAQQRALEVAARIASQEAERAELQAKADSSARSAHLMQARHRQDLATRQLSLGRELAQIETERARLEVQRDEATLRAPVSGAIAELDYPATGTTVPRGATLAVISQPLGQPFAELRVPPNYIDQVRTGQDGILTVPGLPQRNMPRIGIEVMGVADSPVRDPAGNVQYYTARVMIDPADLAKAEHTLGGRFHLVAGMPVSAALNGAPTSLWHYLAAPLVDTLRMGFEE
ncbi:MAG: HlyD family efflux transporter periplasmic adaptor subunit [Rhodobacteraceae bacterium]|nr:HlyD family efflux transporter periplasmic adaptor subunit [Paracoccaceae bacterium]